MLILAVDTTAEFGSIALLENELVREEMVMHAPKGFSGILFGQMKELLIRQRTALSEIDLFAGASGPGSFTGVRVGLAAIKGLGEVLRKPVAAVSNLEALAEFGTGELRACVIDARRGEVFAALYNPAGQQVIPEQVIRFPRFLELLAGHQYEWMPVNSPPSGLAATIARIAGRRPLTGAAAIEANYVRRSDAELLWRE